MVDYPFQTARDSGETWDYFLLESLGRVCPAILNYQRLDKGPHYHVGAEESWCSQNNCRPVWSLLNEKKHIDKSHIFQLLPTFIH